MTTSDAFDENWCNELRRKLTRWYSRNRRKLPWRKTRDPYAIWVSETMLQQTQVATVIDYFNRFLERFPDVESLAAADEEAVLHMWSGLGYYRRARSLHAAAQVIVQSHSGKFPKDVSQVQNLPGIGRYTAGAITSIAYDSRNPILEANTIRLYARLLCLREDPQTLQSQKKLWGFAEAILPKSRGSGQVNQAAMELGSLLCTPNDPQCSSCPLQSLCPTYRGGFQNVIPKARVKPSITEEIHAAVVVRQRESILMRRNQQADWWTGLWDFPRLRLSPMSKPERRVVDRLQPGELLELNSELRQQVESRFLDDYKLPCSTNSMLLRLSHGVTRFRIRLLCFDADVPKGFDTKQMAGEWTWVTLSKQQRLPLTSPAKKIFAQLDLFD